MEQVELLSPAGDFETALAAFAAGADAVYCGLADFSARAFAKNLSEDELRSLVAYARAKGRKVYVTFNTVLDEDQIGDAIRTLARLDDIAPDALIVQDLGVARICRRHFPSLALHASTQLVAHNLEGTLALRDLGFSRVVLARELSLAEIASIAKRCGGLELECFIHGALCYSLSGLCLFGAMEKGRSGNRGKCPYCCRQACQGRYPFSMKDLRLDVDARRLADAGVASLKIEGRMKSPLYVASVTKHYREILDGSQRTVTTADLETVFSRRTTELYLNGPAADVIDPVSLGHLGTPIGTVKRVTKDRDGRAWLRFHTMRALERHDGLQFAAPDGGKPIGFGVGEMRQAISRANVFEVAAGTDVEVLLPAQGSDDAAITPGMTVYCSMSNEVKRRFPIPAFRPSDYPGGKPVDVRVVLSVGEIAAYATYGGIEVSCSVKGEFGPAKSPEKTYAAVEKAFSKLGGTDWSLGGLTLVDADRLFAPMSALNDLRRDLVERLDAERGKAMDSRIEAAKEAEPVPDADPFAKAIRTVKVRVGQRIPAGDWDEVIVAVGSGTSAEDVRGTVGDCASAIRLALPVYNPEPEFGRLRVTVKRLAREGFRKWEASDLATLSLLKAAGVDDVTADWTLYAFNTRALASLSELGVRRFVASPENGRENLRRLAESGFPIEFLAQQSTPLFISLTKPVAEQPDGLAVFMRDGLWVTTKPVPRTFDVPDGASSRLDLSWNLE